MQRTELLTAMPEAPARAHPEAADTPTPPATARVLIIKTGHTTPTLSARLGDFEDWIVQGLRSSGLGVAHAVTDPRLPHANLPRPEELAASGTGVVITGSHAMVTDREPWNEATAAWLAGVARTQRVPVLGICYGHQLLAHALGGEVWPHPGGLELGSVNVHATPAAANDALMGHLPAAWSAHTVHRQSVRHLPAGAVHLAHNAFEPHHAFRWGRCAWGVQFHPEFSTEAMRGYIRHLANDSGVPATTLHQAQVLPTPHAASLLGRFATLVATNPWNTPS
jgi:GMP synthase (glutamine-hydrolysing)